MKKTKNNNKCQNFDLSPFESLKKNSLKRSKFQTSSPSVSKNNHDESVDNFIPSKMKRLLSMPIKKSNLNNLKGKTDKRTKNSNFHTVFSPKHQKGKEALKIQSNESIKDFDKRINKVTRPFIAQQIQESKQIRVKRKLYLTERKNKTRKNKTENNEEHLDSVKRKLPPKEGMDKIKFGEVVKAPPKIKIMPKLELKMEANEFSALHFTKKTDQPREELEMLRNQAIQLYRTNKFKSNLIH